jgi:hypothetical protein
MLRADRQIRDRLKLGWLIVGQALDLAIQREQQGKSRCNIRRIDEDRAI